MDNILMALSSLKANKMRSLLTMLGIIIGIGSVIAITTVGNSLTGSITSSMSSLGVNNVTVSVTQKDSSNAQEYSRMFVSDTLSEDDKISDEMIAEFQLAYPDEVGYVSISENVGSETITNKTNSATINLLGVNEQYHLANDVTLITGRWINEVDEEETKKICVVSNQFVTDYFAYRNVAAAIGQEVLLTINGHSYQFYVAGIYEYQQTTATSSMFSQSQTTTTELYVPLKTAQKLNNSGKGYSSITIIANNKEDATTFLDQCQAFFASFYTHNDSYTIQASNMSSLVDTVSSMLQTVTLAISAIAAISLLVGGIGVMNIMLVSITERTREIGTRKALGAQSSSIRLQFITEAVIICLIGGLIGIIAGVGLGTLGAVLLGYPGSVDVTTCIIAVAFSMAVGVFFGYYPANKAAKMDPIDALRYE